MANRPFHRVQAADGAEITYILGADDDPATVDNVDAESSLPNGNRYAATILTLNQIDTIMRRWEQTGECLAGAYLRVPDLVIVRKPGVSSMTRALKDLLSAGQVADLPRLE